MQRLLDRGVWLAPYLVDEVPVLIAVDRSGVVRKHVKLREGVDEGRATDWLWHLLDKLDPPSQLRLVSEEPAPVVPVNHYADPRSPQSLQRYRQRLVANAARKLPRFRDTD